MCGSALPAGNAPCGCHGITLRLNTLCKGADELPVHVANMLRFARLLAAFACSRLALALLHL